MSETISSLSNVLNESQQSEKQQNESQELEVIGKDEAGLLIEAGGKVLQKILEDFPHELPEVVIYTDTSARVLRYLFEPGFAEAARLRNVKVPKTVFFQPSPYYRQITEELEKGTSLGDQILEYTDKAKKYENSEDIYLAMAEAAKVYPQMQDVMRERMQEIVNECGLKGEETKRVIVIDELSHTGETLRRITDLYKEVTGEDTHMYALTQLNEGIGPNIFSGYVSGRMWLTYNHEVEHEEKGLRHLFGVSKAAPEQLSPHATADGTSTQYMAKLRKDMRTIGKMIPVSGLVRFDGAEVQEEEHFLPRELINNI